MKREDVGWWFQRWCFFKAICSFFMYFTFLPMCAVDSLLWIIAWFVFLPQRSLLSVWSSFSTQCSFSVLYDAFLGLFSHSSGILQWDHLSYNLSQFTVFSFALLSSKTASHCPTQRGSIFLAPKLGSCWLDAWISIGCIRSLGALYIPDSLLLLCGGLFH